MFSHKYRLFIFLGIISLVFVMATPVLAEGAPIGCCLKYHNDPKPIEDPTSEDLTEANCKAIKKDYKSTSWFANKRASDNNCDKDKLDMTPAPVGEIIKFTPQVTIPGSDFVGGQEITLADSTKPLAEYIIAILKYTIGIIGVIAAIVLMIGGVRWLTAAGNSGAVGEAKKMIIGSLTGLVLTLGSFLLLSTISPNLIKLKITPVKRLQYVGLEMGCCLKHTDPVTTATISKDECALVDYATTEFFKDQVAMDNRCEEVIGCCLVQNNENQFLFFEGRTISEVCFNGVIEKNCESKESSWMTQYSYGLGVQFVKVLFGEAGDVDAEFKLGTKCQDWDECQDEDIKIIEKE